MTEHFLVPADLWTELFTYIAARVDVRDGGDGRQLPNSAMTLYDRMEREAKLARPEEGALKDAIELLEVCRSCDLHYDAWAAFCNRQEIHGLKVHDRLRVFEVVDAFLAKHKSPREQR